MLVGGNVFQMNLEHSGALVIDGHVTQTFEHLSCLELRFWHVHLRYRL